MKKCSLEMLLGKRLAEPYESQYRYVMERIESGKIRPVKTSPRNGKRPALYTQYWLVEEKPDYSAFRDELLYQTSPLIHVDYYLRHPEVYVQERPYVRRLSAYLQKRQATVTVSRNERSFEIWGEEKFLSGNARSVLSHCGTTEAELNVYYTAEPFAYYAARREVPQKLLILENKDPFFGMRKFLLEGHECPGKGAFRRRHALGQGGGQGFAQGILARAGDGFLPPGEIFQLHLQREAEHQPEQVRDHSPVIGKPCFTAPGALGPREKPLAHFCDGGIPAHNPAAAFFIVGQGAQGRALRPGLSAQIHGKKRLVGLLRRRFFFP